MHESPVKREEYSKISTAQVKPDRRIGLTLLSVYFENSGYDSKRCFMRLIVFVFSIALSIRASGQDKTLPYYKIPDAPESFSAGTVAARMIDGLGFRYYWATEGLREQDLAFKPGADARTTEETLRHIHALTSIIMHASTSMVYAVQPNPPKVDFATLRKETLENLKAASDRLRALDDKQMNALKIIFKRETGTNELPFWNLINGPIADALWHVGQVVSFRRSSGNPFPDKANLFTGSVRAD